MSEIHPFKAYRYDLPGAKLKNAVCPPYDIIGDKLERSLRKCKSNAVHIELPEGTPETKYGNAANIWKTWKEKGVVRQDPQPCFYIYEQIFTAYGRKYARKGFFCEVRVEKPGEGSVLRHELTISGPKIDRLNLLRKIRINTSPVFGLFQDAGRKVGAVLKAVSAKKPDIEFKDADKVTHRLWLCSGSRGVSIIRETLAKTPVLIADGHHRYETSWNYLQENKVGGSGSMLFFLCPMEDKGLVIFPTHRIVRDSKLLSLDTVLKKLRVLADVFSIRSVSKQDALRVLSKGNCSFAATDGKKFFVVNVKSRKELKKKLAGRSDASADLPLVQLHSLVIPEMQKEDFIYVHEDKEAVELAAKNRTVSLLVPAASSKQLYDIVRSGELMPQKSTYFYPKVITGMVFRSLD